MYPPMIGSITLFPYDFNPEGWKFCDGSVLSLFDSESLFFLLQNSFGGDAEQGTFGLPDLRAVAPPECRYCIALFGESRNARYEGLTGETMISATSVNPSNLVECAGQSLPINRNVLLHHFIGNRFGGADAGHFKLPDLRGKAPDKCRYMIATGGGAPGPGDGAFVGEIMLLPYDQPPQDWRLCNGDLLPVGQHTALYSVLMNRFGGNKGSTFGLPDLRAATPPNFNYYISTRGMLPVKTS